MNEAQSRKISPDRVATCAATQSRSYAEGVQAVEVKVNEDFGFGSTALCMVEDAAHRQGDS
jgi:hypothetical protein